MAEDPEQLRGYLNLIFVSRCLERVGDHATNMAEDAVYAAAAEDIRHQHFVPGYQKKGAGLPSARRGCARQKRNGLKGGPPHKQKKFKFGFPGKGGGEATL